MAKSKAKKGTKPSSATSGTSAGHSGSAVTNTTDHDLNPTDLVGGSSAILTNKERKKKGYVQSGKLASAQRGIEDMDLDEPESDSEGSHPCISLCATLIKPQAKAFPTMVNLSRNSNQ